MQFLEITPVSMVIAKAGQSLTHFRHLVQLFNSMMGMVNCLEFQKWELFNLFPEFCKAYCSKTPQLRRQVIHLTSNLLHRDFMTPL
jgi:hypothetical protein